MFCDSLPVSSFSLLLLLMGVFVLCCVCVCCSCCSYHHGKAYLCMTDGAGRDGGIMHSWRWGLGEGGLVGCTAPSYSVERF